MRYLVAGAMVLVLALPVRADGQTIDFETLPDGSPTVEGMIIHNQYDVAPYGVRFSLIGANPNTGPLIAQVGSPRTAFQGPNRDDPNCNVGVATTNDMPALGQGVGCFFLTDDGNLGPSVYGLLVEFSPPVLDVSGVILDIQSGSFNETWTVRAFDAGGSLVGGPTVFTEGDPGTGEGLATPWSFASAGGIAELTLEYSGLPGAGLAFDNFRFSRPGCTYLVHHEDQPPGTHYGTAHGQVPGDVIFVENGIPVRVEPFDSGGGVFFNECDIRPALVDFGDGQIMGFNNINNRYDIGALALTVSRVSFEYADFGGTENIQVNGAAMHVGELDAAPVNIAPGVTLTHTPITVGGAKAGLVVLTGVVHDLVVGGQEFVLDNVCAEEGEPPPPCDFLVDHQSQGVGTTYGSGDGHVPGDVIFTEDGIPVRVESFDSGVNVWFNQCVIQPAPAEVGDGNVMWFSNISNLYEIAALGITTDTVTFEYADYGGTENIQVNGGPLFVGELDAAPVNIAPGVTLSVAPIAVGGAKGGLVTLTGNVEKLLLGGQEFLVDNVCVHEGEPPPPCEFLVHHQSLAVGTVFGPPTHAPGDWAFSESGVDVYVEDFDTGSGVFFNQCQVVAALPDMGHINVMAFNNISNRYDATPLGIVTDTVTFEYADIGGTENIRVNGGALYVGELDTAPFNIAPGVTFSVAPFPVAGGKGGLVTLTGDVQDLLVGGQEFFVDNVCFHPGEPPEPCDHLVDHQSQAPGTLYGTAGGHVPGQWIFSEDGIPVSVVEFDHGGGTLFDRCEIVSVGPSGFGAGHVMQFTNISNRYELSALGFVPAVVEFEYADFGGIENIQVNHAPLYVGELDAAPVNIAPGVSLSISPYGVGSGKGGHVTLAGPVYSLTLGGQEFFVDTVCVKRGDGTGTEPMGRVAIGLSQNFPNPFNPRTTISFTLDRSRHTRLAVYDLAGRLVDVMIDRIVEAGAHQEVWDGTDLRGRAVASGTYVIRLEAEGASLSRKLTLLR